MRDYLELEKKNCQKYTHILLALHDMLITDWIQLGVAYMQNFWGSHRRQIQVVIMFKCDLYGIREMFSRVIIFLSAELNLKTSCSLNEGIYKTTVNIHKIE